MDTRCPRPAVCLGLVSLGPGCQGATAPGFVVHAINGGLGRKGAEKSKNSPFFVPTKPIVNGGQSMNGPRATEAERFSIFAPISAFPLRAPWVTRVAIPFQVFDDFRHGDPVPGALLLSAPPSINYPLYVGDFIPRRSARPLSIVWSTSYFRIGLLHFAQIMCE